MGGGASNLTAEQSERLTQLMKNEYENCSGTDDEKRAKLASKYSEHLATVVSDKTDKDKQPDSARSKGPAAVKPSKPKLPTRRRSFEGKGPVILVSESSPRIPDSVTNAIDEAIRSAEQAQKSTEAAQPNRM